MGIPEARAVGPVSPISSATSVFRILNLSVGDFPYIVNHWHYLKQGQPQHTYCLYPPRDYTLVLILRESFSIVRPYGELPEKQVFQLPRNKQESDLLYILHKPAL